MKNLNSTGADPALDRLLDEWQQTSPLPPRFGAGVWHRIERSEPQNPFAVFGAWIVQALRRPGFAASYVVVLTLAGFGAGLWQSHAAAARMTETLSARYVQSISPYNHPGR